MRFDQRGSGPAVVLVPGLGCDDRMWRPVAQGLAERFAVTLPETWGVGSLHAAAQGIKVILDQLGVTSAGVAGLSMGGYITFELLRHWPQKVKAAALLDTTAFPDTAEREDNRYDVLRMIREGKYSEVLDTFVSAVLSPHHSTQGTVRECMVAMGQRLGPEVFASDMNAILKRGSYEDVLQLVRVPLLFIAGEYDPVTSIDVARQMAAEVPGARVEMIHGAGHMTPLESPGRISALLVDFFEGTLAAQWGAAATSRPPAPALPH